MFLFTRHDCHIYARALSSPLVPMAFRLGLPHLAHVIFCTCAVCGKRWRKIGRLGSWVHISLLLLLSAKLPFLPIFLWKFLHCPDTWRKVVIPWQICKANLYLTTVNLTMGGVFTERRQLAWLHWKADTGKCWTCNIYIWVPLSAMFFYVG